MHKTELAETAEQSIRRLEEGLETMAELPDDVIHMASSGWVEEGYVGLRFPYDLRWYRQARQILLDHGWKLKKRRPVSMHNNGNRCTILRKNGHQLNLWMMPDLDGSTCTKEQVGEKTIPVYKVSCK